MADQRNTIEVLARHLISATRPLIEAGSSFGAFKRLMARLGFDATNLPPAYAAVATAVTNALNRIRDLSRVAYARADHRAARGCEGRLRGDPEPRLEPATGGRRCWRLCGRDRRAAVRAAADRLSGDRATAAFNVLAMLRVIEVETVPATATRPGYVRTHFRWDELPNVINPRATCQRACRVGHAGLQRRACARSLGEPVRSDWTSR